METGMSSPSTFEAGSTTNEFFVLVSLDDTTSEPKACALVDLKLSGKIEFVGPTVIEPDDKVLLRESDSLMGERRRVPKIGMELLVPVGKMEGFVASC